MAVQDITFRTLPELRSAARNAHFIDYAWKRGEDGLLRFTSYQQDPRVVAICETFDAKARERIATGEALKPAAERKPREPRHTGELPITKQIRVWVHQHPNCVKAEALAAFPGVNPSTVSVQFGKAKKGEL